MFIELNFKSGKPAYLQIVEQIKFSAAMGDIKPGNALPSIRSLAEQLRINRNTIAKAYSILEHEGVVETIQGKGVFIKNTPSPFARETRTEILSKLMDTAIVQAHHFRIPWEELLNLFNQRYKDFENRRSQMEPSGNTPDKIIEEDPNEPDRD
jgi:GntR family transcriptional regulator